LWGSQYWLQAGFPAGPDALEGASACLLSGNELIDKAAWGSSPSDVARQLRVFSRRLNIDLGAGSRVRSVPRSHAAADAGRG